VVFLGPGGGADAGGAQSSQMKIRHVIHHFVDTVRRGSEL